MNTLATEDIIDDVKAVEESRECGMRFEMEHTTNFEEKVLAMLALYIQEMPAQDVLVMPIHDFVLLCTYIPPGYMTENELGEMILTYFEKHPVGVSTMMQVLQIVDFTQLSPDFVHGRMMRSSALPHGPDVSKLRSTISA
jgi:hypothetical protein